MSLSLWCSPCCCYQKPLKGRCILDHMVGNPADESLGQLVTVHSLLESREREESWCSVHIHYSPSDLVQDLSLWDGATYILSGSSHPIYHDLEIPPHACSKACLLGNCRSCQVHTMSRHCLCSGTEIWKENLTIWFSYPGSELLLFRDRDVLFSTEPFAPFKESTLLAAALSYCQYSIHRAILQFLLH